MIMSLILGDTFLQKYFSIDFINTKEEKREAKNLIGYQVVSKKEYFNNFMQINTLQSNILCRFQSIKKNSLLSTCYLPFCQKSRLVVKTSTNITFALI